jgi:hypothetical protein
MIAALRRWLVAFLVVAMAPPAAAAPNPDFVTRSRKASAESVIRVADCTVSKQPEVAAAWVLDHAAKQPVPPKLLGALIACLGADFSSSQMRGENNVWRGAFGMAFVRQPRKIPAGLVVPPLPAPATESFDIVVSVATCVVAAEGPAARRFADSLAGLPEERERFAAISEAAGRCLDPWPQVAITLPLLRAGLGVALFRQAAASP